MSARAPRRPGPVRIRRDALVEALDRATQSRVIVAVLDALGLEMMEIKPLAPALAGLAGRQASGADGGPESGALR
jgi:hypothetical protein